MEGRWFNHRKLKGKGGKSVDFRTSRSIRTTEIEYPKIGTSFKAKSVLAEQSQRRPRPRGLPRCDP